MSRERLPDRRIIIERVDHRLAGGKSLSFLVTFGFDKPQSQGGHVREVFCADFKAGSDNFALIMDACVAISRLMQYGDTPRAIADTFSTPPSILGSIALAAAHLDET